MRVRRRWAVGAAAVAVGLAAAFAAAVVLPTSASDPEWVFLSKLHAKRLAGDLLIPVAAWLHPLDRARLGPFTPLEGPGFFYEDLDHPYLKRIARDPRLAPFYGPEPFTPEKAAAMADFLRGRFAAGWPSMDVESANLLELLDAAERGERFWCGTAAKMLVQMAQAAGAPGRRVRLGGHVVAEVWFDAWGWVAIDPHVNVYYRDRQGRPLSVLAVHRLVRAGEPGALVPVRGTAPHSRWEEHQEHFHEVWSSGFAVDFYAKWLSMDLPAWDPRLSPSRTSVYFAPADEPGRHPYYRRVVRDPALLYRPPGRTGSGARTAAAARPGRLAREAASRLPPPGAGGPLPGMGIAGPHATMRPPVEAMRPAARRAGLLPVPIPGGGAAEGLWSAPGRVRGDARRQIGPG